MNLKEAIEKMLEWNGIKIEEATDVEYNLGCIWFTHEGNRYWLSMGHHFEEHWVCESGVIKKVK